MLASDIWKRVVDHAPEAIVVVDQSGGILCANRAACALFGYSATELAGRPVEALVPERIRGLHAGGPRISMTGHTVRTTPSGLNLFGLRKDGTEFAAEVGLSPITEAGELLIVANVRDITDRRAMERSNLQLAALVSHAQEFLAIANLDGRVVFVNEFGRQVHGIGVDEDLGDRRIPDFVDNTHHDRLKFEVIPALLAVGRWSGQLDFRRKGSAAPVPTLITGFRIDDVDGRPLAFACVSSEISDLHRIDAIRAALSRTNQAIIRARTEAELLDQVCRIGAEDAGFALVWIGLLDADGVLRVAAAAGPAVDYLEGLRITVDEGSTEGRGPGGRALRSGQHVIVEDIESNEMMRPWRDRAGRFGLRCSGAFPLFRDGRVIGILSAHSTLSGHFGSRETSLLDDMAADVSFGLDNLDQATLLAYSLEQLREIEATVGVGALRVLLPEWSFWWSDGTPEVLGLPRGTDAKRQSFEQAVGTEIMLIFGAALDEAALTGNPVDIDLPLRGLNASGSHWVRVSGVPRRRPDGTTEVSCTLQDVSERKRLESEVTAAADYERLRLGAELHDNLGQILVGSSMILSGVAREARNAGSSLLPRIERAIEALNEALRVCRVIAHGTEPVVQGDLTAALVELAARTTETGVECVASVAESANTALKGAAALEVYRVAQEAVTNSLKHAQCRRIDVRCSVSGPIFELFVSDDGQGLESRSQPPNGIGMRTMRHRAARAGGTLEVRSRAGVGTTVRLRIPLIDEGGMARDAPWAR